MLQTKHLFAAALFFTFGWQFSCLPINSSCSDGLVSSINKNIVLVIDVSASMESQDKLQEVGSVLKEWIFSTVPCYAHVGIVQFASRARILSNLTLVNDESRSEIVEKIPTFAQGETCISCGLEKAIEVLGVNGNTTDSSVFVLITDANDSELKLDDDIMRSLEESKVQVVPAVLSDETDALENVEKLTERTRGFSRYIQDEHIFKDLMEVLTLVGLPPMENLTTTVLTETTVTSLPMNDSTASILTVSTMDTFTENSTNASVTLIEDTTIHQNSDYVTTVGESEETTTSACIDCDTAMPSVTPFEGNVTVTSPTNTTLPPVKASPPWLYICSGIIAAILIVGIVVIYCRWCKKREANPCARRGVYAPIPLKSRPIHGDQVLAKNYNLRPNSSYS